ncbi:protein C-mannosyl-transferase DPY19L1-like [Lineus longissimus]|uniref:protein C-mannosyl-transferase DPY19L1-like n=1 Tax=Lineus longissimus TaxID=88925 RepID=UPI002B4F7E46
MVHKRKYPSKRSEHSSKFPNGSFLRHERNGGGRLTEDRGERQFGSSWKKERIVYVVLTVFAACVAGIMHRNHIAGMFERHLHFSHLSELDRDLSLKTEMGLYFSYYKTMITSPTFFGGLNEIIYDNVTEYPKTINTLKRFNLYPEVVLAVCYRLYDRVTKYFNIETKQCWKTTRGGHRPPTISCEGLGDVHYFYTEMIFFVNGASMTALFLFGWYLSESFFGGVLVVASFFYNHGECTRVQWSPNLRENFAYPFLVIQMFTVTLTLKSTQPDHKHSLLIALATACFILPWQFGQFVLVTQTMSLFAMYILQIINSHKLIVILVGQSVGLWASFIFLFGNEMLLTSYLFAALVTAHILTSFESFIFQIKRPLIIMMIQGASLVAGTLTVKRAMSMMLSVKDDAHISAILLSKFTNFSNFHTKMYTCNSEFDFMAFEIPMRMSKTLLLPSVGIIVVAIICNVLKKPFEGSRNTQMKSVMEHDTLAHGFEPHAELVYHVFQLASFSLMAMMIMRLKLLWTPHMCLVTSLLASRKLFGCLFSEKRSHLSAIVLVLALMSYQGVQNLAHQWAVKGEFADLPLEEMTQWVKGNTPRDAVFAGPMPTMATIKLVTERSIVNHPHYEDAQLRERTKIAYAWCSRKPPHEVKRSLKGLGVDYLIMESAWCFGHSNTGCTMLDTWDADDVENRNRPSTCVELFKKPEPYFKAVFKNNAYVILKL